MHFNASNQMMKTSNLGNQLEISLRMQMGWNRLHVIIPLSWGTQIYIFSTTFSQMTLLGVAVAICCAISDQSHNSICTIEHFMSNLFRDVVLMYNISYAKFDTNQINLTDNLPLFFSSFDFPYFSLCFIKNITLYLSITHYQLYISRAVQLSFH